ncbi:MAG TPA: chemotaxis protein [Rhodobiaceae bacterium]|jgi:PAS domain S-box-containing protein|nr:chemotaxis protein [Rhodobiaceae bacterium]|tara:strand:+ start:9310 stop:9843 length:534 start_codon:yes stop_codon:yes gene_type:complete
MARQSNITGKEVSFGEDEVIVSKTNLKGHIVYCNDVFLRVSGFTENEVVGQPHNLIRHPEMPRVVFKLLWDTIQSGQEIFAYVNNRAKNGDNYWVLAHVTPSRNSAGQVVGYHSNRRVPDRSILTRKIIPLYEVLLQEERKHSNGKVGLTAAYDMLVAHLEGVGMEYDEFIATLQAA